METYLGVNGISRSVGSGKLILFGFMPYQGYTDLIFNPNFVQMVLRLLWDARDWDSYFSDNGSFQEWKSKKLSQDHAYTMVDESGASRNLTVNGTGDKAQLLFPPDFDPGIYSVMEDGVEIMRFGHNVDAGDSSVAAVRSADLQQVMEKTGLFYGPAADLSKGYERRDLTLWTAILLLLALALEAYAHFFRKTS